MKAWQLVLMGVLFGLLAAGVVLLLVLPGRGEPVQLPESTVETGIAVDVGGAVAQPGVYRLPVGSRVSDAVEAAGGMLPEAYNEIVNMAGPLSDGSKVLVPVRPAGAASGADDEQAASSEDGGLVNINTANKDALMSLPGIGETKAEAIIAYRTENGVFTAPEQIMDVPGIGPGIFDNLKDLITVY